MLQYLQKCISIMGGDVIEYVYQVAVLYLENVEFERLEPIISLLCYASAYLKSELASAISKLFPGLFARISQQAIPTSSTSETDRVNLHVFLTFLRLVQVSVDNVEVKNFAAALPNELPKWLLHAMQTHPDKSSKKVVVQILKAFIIQVSNLKYQ